MAAEGLDIKSLTTLFMITPMTNIEQSVGRILRQKHEFDPIVVDIIDSHDNFQKQWSKRKTFYKKQNYKIIQINSVNYSSDVSKWKVIYEPIFNKQKQKNCKELTKEPLNPSSRSSSDKSIADDTDTDTDTDLEDEVEEKTDKLKGVCLLKFKK
jgi:hypothetical protein